MNGEFEALIPLPTLSETYYVSAKIYQKLGRLEPEEISAQLVEWIFEKLPSVTIPPSSKDIAIEAGRAKLKYSLSMTDCYVLATSQIYNCKALFKTPEDEMQRKIINLKRAYQLAFLSGHR